MRRLTVLVLSIVALTGLAAGDASAERHHPDYWTEIGYRYCGSFTDGTYWMDIYARKMGCHKAMRVQREYWLGPESRKTRVNGGHGADGYTVLHRFPGWRCYSGSGGGTCNKGKRSAAYTN